VVAEGKQCVRLLKKFPPTLNFDLWPPLIEKTLEKAKLKVEDIDMFIFTQIRKVTIVDVMKKYGLPMEKTHTIMESGATPASACIPMALHDAVSQEGSSAATRSSCAPPAAASRWPASRWSTEMFPVAESPMKESNAPSAAPSSLSRVRENQGTPSPRSGRGPGEGS